MRPFRELTGEDVGKPYILAFGRVWSVTSILGRIVPEDVGRRLYLVDGIIQAENDTQRNERLDK